MVDRLPPLKSLEAFVVAGRLRSFGKAGAQLGLSPSAVSRRIRNLETELGVSFFERRSKCVELTAAGVRYLDALSPTFDAIRRATAEIRTDREIRRLVVFVPRSLAARWLTPRLPDFRARYPDIDLEIEVSLDISGHLADGYDVGIFLSLGNWPNHYAECILPITVFPVCSPAVAKELHTQADLASQTLLHVRQLPKAWPEWFRAAGMEQISASREIIFNDVQLAFEAALNGLGVAIGADVVVTDYLKDGRLVVPFGPRVRSAFKYHLVCQKCRLRDPSVRKFITWARECAAATELH